jgi:hypothetical protein
MGITSTHMHTHTHTHTQSCLEARGEIREIVVISGFLKVWTLSCLKIITQLRKIHEVTSYPKMSLEGSYTTTFRPMKKYAECILCSPECMHETITVWNHLCKPMMHMGTCRKIFELTLHIFNECCSFSPDKLSQLIYRIATLSHT